ncbi:cytochrome c1 [Sphingomonas sanguinis]|jgi:ubiquinol-cytochrome c reductase cytochrome c1 subunit|uniref:Cytochrome c1 n=1 Tax=Sphingomonas sanguinis TaxID=33051 RepID=A0A147INB5_9SPHN|nr:cytochrome c1 [Sphingomonas sanguinis]KTT96553.1 cytochrome C [Sphingomonas sanguinis]KTW16306.1 cytochrome C [Sphingomonas sanguinis]MBZ6382121.1 cytochrome c1 [Sphingomonas sanguinis]NNG49072.1 cytochrome c1 [Sphingomonas sanguinis]NNG52677.1 cytochrome c1 [Sphingomonas sanguinis]
MVRGIAFLVGAAFTFVLAIALWGSISGLVSEPPAPTAEEEFHLHPKQAHLASDGIMGRFDRRQLQRGFQVYKEVCAACHSLRLVAFRDLKDLGYNDPEVKAIANQWVIEQPSINPETGEATTRKNVPADHFPSPFANEVAARAANNNALPPDLSLMTKARHDGTNYIYSLVGPDAYRNQPAELLRKFPDIKTPTGLHYNPYFANLNIAMPPPLTSDGQVQYTDGTLATRDQMAKDVAAFLTWTAEPKLEARHSAGIGAVVFILIFCFLAWGAYQNVWRDVKH